MLMCCHSQDSMAVEKLKYEAGSGAKTLHSRVQPPALKLDFATAECYQGSNLLHLDGGEKNTGGVLLLLLV